MTVTTVTVRSENGKDRPMSLSEFIQEGQLAYIQARAPSVHLVACGDNLPAAAGLHLVTTDGTGGFSHTTGLILSATNRAAFSRGALPTDYPLRAETSYSAAMEALAEYRRAAKAATKTTQPEYLI